MKSSYYDRIWAEKLSLPRYSSIEARWRSRWEFALQEIAAASRVADAGCGDGVLGELLIEQLDCSVTGLDISKYALERALKRGVQTYACDISNETFPLPDGSFDVVTLLCCLEHVFDPAHALAEAARIVRPGGKILVTLPNAVHCRNRFNFLRGRLSQQLLHTRSGEGLHIRFWDYRRDFAQFLDDEVDQLVISKQFATLKNSADVHGLRGSLRKLAARVWPNLCAEYVHYVLVLKERSETL